jgi:hypothetical protein
VNELPDWLLACIAEDEAEARAWRAVYSDPGPVPTYHYETMRRHRREWPLLWRSLDRFTPARALAMCEAHRRIIDLESYDRPKLGAPPYNGPLNDPEAGGRHPQLVAYIEEHGERVTDTPILRALALAYADRPGYRPEWRLVS